MKIDLNQIIHQPIRTKIMAFLVRNGSSDFVTLKTFLHLSDGHMSTHMKLLSKAGYIEIEKSFVENKPKTIYKVSKEGRKKFNEYVGLLKQLINLK